MVGRVVRLVYGGRVMLRIGSIRRLMVRCAMVALVVHMSGPGGTLPLYRPKHD